MAVFAFLVFFFSEKIGPSDVRMKLLCKEPVNTWRSARERFKRHYLKSTGHKDAVVFMENFKRRIKDQSKNVDLLANSAF